MLKYYRLKRCIKYQKCDFRMLTILIMTNLIYVFNIYLVINRCKNNDNYHTSNLNYKNYLK